uniref:FMRFamide-related neuropeptides-like n=1 Tax=Bursaphelenchus xylophilus TaxID=6326 RepID=A0A1I7SAA2_BURXY
MTDWAGGERVPKTGGALGEHKILGKVMRTIFTVLTVCFLQVLCLSQGQNTEDRSREQRYVLHKRAFDRVDLSPFDFGAYSKRYNNDLRSLYRKKKSFDRLDQGPFGLVKRKRVFDRVDAGFGFGKRSSEMAVPGRISLSDLVSQAQSIEPID